MKAEELIEIIKDDLNLAKEQKTQTIKIENFEAWYDDLKNFVKDHPEPEPSPVDQNNLEEYKAKVQRGFEHYRAVQQHRLEVFKTVINAGQAALKSAILINGGGSVAILAFIGNILKPGDPIKAALVHSLGGSLRMFAVGTLCAAMAAGGTYLVQFFDAAGLDSKCPKIWRGLAHIFNALVIATVIYSYIRFWLGVDYAYIAFSN